MISEHSMCSGEQGMVDEAQKALEEAEALKKVDSILLPPLRISVHHITFFLSNKSVHCCSSLHQGRRLLQGILLSILLLMFEL